jgi:hypothetical protein
LAQLYAALVTPAGSQLTGCRLTLREVMKIRRRQKVLGLPLPIAAMSLLGPRVQHSEDVAAQLMDIFKSLGGEFAELDMPRPEQYMVKQQPAAVRFQAGPKCWLDVQGASLRSVDGAASSDQMPAMLRMGLVQLAFAAAAGEPVMLVGPTSCKSKLVATWAAITGRKKFTVHLTPGECCLLSRVCGLGRSE